MRASELTRQILGFARGGKYEVKATDINALLEKTAEMFGRTRREITIRKDLQKDPWKIEADQSQLQQVLLNLLVNAWQAMPGGGELVLQTANVVIEAGHPDTPADAVPGPHVRIDVTDTGVGMDTHTQARIFEPFFTTREKGQGTASGCRRRSASSRTTTGSSPSAARKAADRPSASFSLPPQGR